MCVAFVCFRENRKRKKRRYLVTRFKTTVYFIKIAKKQGHLKYLNTKYLKINKLQRSFVHL